jgi:hypothetical protein
MGECMYNNNNNINNNSILTSQRPVLVVTQAKRQIEQTCTHKGKN